MLAVLTMLSVARTSPDTWKPGRFGLKAVAARSYLAFGFRLRGEKGRFDFFTVSTSATRIYKSKKAFPNGEGFSRKGWRRLLFFLFDSIRVGTGCLFSRVGASFHFGGLCIPGCFNGVGFFVYRLLFFTITRSDGKRSSSEGEEQNFFHVMWEG